MSSFSDQAGRFSSSKRTSRRRCPGSCGSEPDKIRKLARRGEAWGNSESRQMLERAIETGRRGVPEAYA
jgi:hypothetical protein